MLFLVQVLVLLPLLDEDEEPELELEPELGAEPSAGELEPEPLAGEVEPEELEEPEPEEELEPEFLPEVGADAGIDVGDEPFFVVAAPLVLVLAGVVLTVWAPPVAVTGEPTGVPVWVGLSPVYANTGSMNGGVTGSTPLVARPFSWTTGLSPGSEGRVPVVISSTPWVMRQVPPDVKVKKPAVEQQVGSPKAALVHWHLLRTLSKTPCSQPKIKSA